MSNSHKRTYIGVLASRDAAEPNKELIDIFNKYFNNENDRKDFSSKFHFIFTGGTYKRVFEGFTDPYKRVFDGYTDPKFEVKVLNDDVSNWLKTCSTPLPTTQEGGVIFLSYLVCQHKCSIVWMFFDANTIHWQRQENLALMRLCDQWHAKKLINSRSVEMWLKHEIEIDYGRNLQPDSPELIFRKRKNETEQNRIHLDELLKKLEGVSKKKI